MTADYRFNRIYLSISLGLLCIPQVLRAQPAPVDVVFTESPGGVLTETVSGVPIGNWVFIKSPPEQWQDTALAGEGNIILTGNTGLGWYEPGSTTSFNVIDTTEAVSDVPFFDPASAAAPVAQDGVAIPFSVSGALVVNASLVAVPANFTFNDLGDVAVTAPDATSTLTLSLLACTSLVILRRYSAMARATV